MKSDNIRDVVLSGPPVAVAGASFAGMPLSEWVLILTIGWLVMQMGGWTYDRLKRKKETPDAE